MWSFCRLFICYPVFLSLVYTEALAQQSTPMDFFQVIRSFNSLNADGLENKVSRDEYCKGLPPDRAPLCGQYMDSLGAARRKMDLSLTAIEEAVKKGSVDRKILLRLDAQISAYVSLRNFVFLWLDEK
jgi:hypothetical protein